MNLLFVVFYKIELLKYKFPTKMTSLGSAFCILLINAFRLSKCKKDAGAGRSRERAVPSVLRTSPYPVGSHHAEGEVAPRLPLSRR